MSVYVFKYLSVHIMIVYNYVYTCIHIVHTRLCDGVQWIIMSHMIQTSIGNIIEYNHKFLWVPQNTSQATGSKWCSSGFNQGEYSLSPLIIVKATISFVKPNILPYTRRKSLVKSNVSFRVLRYINLRRVVRKFSSEVGHHWWILPVTSRHEIIVIHPDPYTHRIHVCYIW